jgi:membrane protein required for colicin V production
LPIVDLLAAAALALAVLRGMWIGIVREVFSLTALATAVLAVRRLAAPLASDIAMSYQLDPLVATAIAGGGVAVASILVVAVIGWIVRRLVRTAGLGPFDRIGGAALGAAEGALFVAVLLFGVISLTGRSDPLIAGTRSLAAFEALERWVGAEPPPPRQAVDVSAPRSR